MPRRLGRYGTMQPPITAEEVKSAGTVLFAVFTRYGDGIIAFKAAKEFIEQHPDKRYVVVTSRQLLSYAQKLLAGPVRFIVLKKRHPLSLLKTMVQLEHFNPDLGFNPSSYGDDSRFCLTYAHRFSLFKASGFGPLHNLYRRAREHLTLEHHVASPQPREAPEVVRRILLCPFSSRLHTSLSGADTQIMVEHLRSKYREAKITLALDNRWMGRVRGLRQVEFFVFGKSRRRSRSFLELLQETDLFVGVDSGPLHLADALKKPALGIFGPTAPETVLDADHGVFVVRARELRGTFCNVPSCHDPQCLHALFRGGWEERLYVPSPANTFEVEACRCAAARAERPH